MRIITNIIAYLGVLSWGEIINVIVSDYIVKFVYSVIIAYPAALLVAYVKVKYGQEGYSADFNPFSYKTITKVVDFSSYAKKKLFKPLDPTTDKSAN